MLPLIGCQSPQDTCSFGARAHTYADLFGRAAIVTRALADVAPGPVSIATNTSFAFVASFLGALNAGRVVELPPNLDSRTLEGLRTAGHVVTILHDVPHEKGVCVSELNGWESPPSVSNFQMRAFDPHETIVRLHTSGTTARAHRIDKTAAHLFEEVAALHACFGEVATRVCSVVPSHHIYGLLFGVLLPLARGGAFLSEFPGLPNAIEETLSEHGVTMLIATPSVLRSMQNAELPKGLTIVSSGASLAPTIYDALERNATVYDVLGSSETGGIAYRAKSASRFTPFVQVHIAEGEDKRLELSSPWSSVTHAEDRVHLHDDGTFDYLGRSGTIVKVGGKRLDLASMEAVMRTVNLVDDCVVFAEPDEARGSRIFAVIASQVPLVKADVESVLSRHFERAMLPRHYAFVSALPRLPSGKLPHDALRALF